MKKHSKFLLILVFLFVLSILMKASRFKAVFLSGDDLLLPLQVIKYYPHHFSQFLVFDNLPETINPLGLFIMGHNVMHMLIPLLFAMMFNFFGVGMTEIMWKLPSILISSAIVFPVYYLMRMFVKRRMALVSSLFILFLPIYFTVSRGSLHDVLELFFLVLITLFFCKYFDGKEKYAFWGSLALALYFLDGTFFPLVLILVVYIGFVYNFSKSYISAIRKTWRKLFRLKILLAPIIALLIQFVIFLGPKFVIGRYGGLFGHLFGVSDNPTSYLALEFGVYFKHLLLNFGWVLLPVILLIIVYSFVFFKNFRKESIFLVWFLVYTLPFLFFFHGTYYHTYVTHGAAAALLLVPLVIEDCIRKFRSYSWLRWLLVPVLILLIVGSFGSAYNLEVPSVLATGRALGIYGEDNGIKAAGYWFRQNTTLEVKIYSDAHGGGGIEPWVVIYYAGREPVGVFDAQLDEVRDLFLSKFYEADWFIITPVNKDWVYENSPEPIFLNVVVKSRGKEVLYIYSKKALVPHIITTEEYNDKFDEEYSKTILKEGNIIYNHVNFVPSYS